MEVEGLLVVSSIWLRDAWDRTPDALTDAVIEQSGVTLCSGAVRP